MQNREQYLDKIADLAGSLFPYASQHAQLDCLATCTARLLLALLALHGLQVTLIAYRCFCCCLNAEPRKATR